MKCITDIEGISVGHSSDFDAGTGCTVMLFDRPVFGAVELNGGGTSTRQIDSLLPHGTYGRINAILLTGGSTFGLNATEESPLTAMGLVVIVSPLGIVGWPLAIPETAPLGSTFQSST